MSESSRHRRPDSADAVQGVGRRTPTPAEIYERLAIEPLAPTRARSGERYTSTLGDKRSTAERTRQSQLVEVQTGDGGLYGLLETCVESGDPTALDAAAQKLSDLSGRSISRAMLLEALGRDGAPSAEERQAKASDAQELMQRNRGFKLPVRC